jgi:hypothetical protein
LENEKIGSFCNIALLSFGLAIIALLRRRGLASEATVDEIENMSCHPVEHWGRVGLKQHPVEHDVAVRPDSLKA